MLTKCGPLLLASSNNNRHHNTLLLIVSSSRRRQFASAGHGHGSHEHEHDENAEENAKMEKQPDFYRPGSDSYAYDNPWPKLNKGRLDWMFKDGYRRPLAPEQGGFMRSQWIWLCQYPYEEHKDWWKYHKYMFILSTALSFHFLITCILFLVPDWPTGREWAQREAYLEIVRRRRAGLPLVSRELIERSRVEATLPGEEELRDFDIVI